MLSALCRHRPAAPARVALRVNPDVDAGTHAKITTGRAHNKFGIPFAGRGRALRARRRASRHRAARARRAYRQPDPLRRAVSRGVTPVLRSWSARCATAGMRCVASIAAAASASATATSRKAVPRRSRAPSARRSAAWPEDDRGAGRWLVGPAGVLLASVVLVKRDRASRFVVLDAAMNDLVRPAMYDAWHGIVPLSASDAARTATPADIVGPVCETGDTFARNRPLPALAPNAAWRFSMRAHMVRS